MNDLLLEMYYKWSESHTTEHVLCQMAYKPIEQNINILRNSDNASVLVEIQDHINEYTEMIEKIAFVEGVKRGIKLSEDLKRLGVSI
ncbi:hypothetical protein [Thomasclavelia cocleata]|uniref:hypothetical protein n=1 Tax=Thomasclavelia cocleata TaxID=69824 RepID=UPI00249573D3|nr:hypothetical protein [Thomasclavelia cocleata]